jgi:SAM-dependent methyltransferase
MKIGENVQGIRVSRQNISYYDKIASDYDLILNQNGNNKLIRDNTASKFKDIVKGDCVLDFGGGTGLDLYWLDQENYRIIFCEPSKEMRQIAINRQINELPNANIHFLGDGEVDFRNWNDEFPFKEKVDAILANFAVVNCIPDIKLFFEKLALAIKPGGIVIALILKNGLLRRLQSNLKGTLKSFFTGYPTGFYIDFKGNRQLVYIHTKKSIRRASAGNFQLLRIEQLQKFGYDLIHLKRK